MQPPQNPFGTPNPYNAGQPGYSPAPLPSRGVSMDVIGEAWNYLKPSIGVWIGAFVIYIVISGAFAGLTSLTQTKNANGVPSPNAVSIVFQILSSIVSIVMSGALMKMAISHIRTGRAEIGEMFNIGSVIGNLIIAAILIGLVAAVGLLLCIIPGVIAWLGLAMTNPLIVDQQMGAIDAMKASWEKMKSNLGAFFVLCLVLGVINIAGALLCGLGLFITFPLSQLAIALVYRDLFLGGNMGNTPDMGFMGTPPPIASPQ